TFLIEHIILHNDFSIDMAVYIPVENKYHYHIAVQTDVQELAKLLRNTVFGEDELYAVNKLYNSIKSPKKNGCFIQFKDEKGRLPLVSGYLLNCKSHINDQLIAA